MIKHEDAVIEVGTYLDSTPLEQKKLRLHPSYVI